MMMMTHYFEFLLHALVLVGLAESRSDGCITKGHCRDFCRYLFLLGFSYEWRPKGGK